MRLTLALILLLACLSFRSGAQLVQTVRGTIRNKESQNPLIGARIQVDNRDALIAFTVSGGNFAVQHVPVGKQTFYFRRPGYNDLELPDVLVSSDKEVVLPVAMEESATQQIAEVIVRNRLEYINEMATVSAKIFDVQEAERYAGSRADPARVASNFAGVQGSDAPRNDPR